METIQIKKEKVEEGSSNSPDVKNTLSAMENNINFLMSLSKQQDKILKQATSEIKRLDKIVSKLSGDPSSASRYVQNEDIYEKNRLFVGNISPDTTVADLKSHFSKFGRVVDAFFLRSHPTSQCGIVEFGDEVKVDETLWVLGVKINGRRVNVRKSIKRSARIGGKPQERFQPSKAGRSSRRYSPY